MFERFSEAAKRVIFFARYEAAESGAEEIETEHLLLGVLRDDRGRVMEILTKHGITRERVEKGIASRSRHHPVSSPGEAPVSAEVKRVLELAASESRNDLHIETEHILLGILCQEQCLAAIVLNEFGLYANEAREQLARCQNDPAWRRHQLVEELGIEKACQDPSLRGRLNEGQRQEVEELLTRLRALGPMAAAVISAEGLGESAPLLVEEMEVRERLHRLLVD